MSWRAPIPGKPSTLPPAPCKTTCRKPIPQCSWEDIFQAAELDLNHKGFPTRDDLDAWLLKSGGAASLMAAQTLGQVDTDTQTYARLLGAALRLIALIRDVRRDGRRGRIYLPDELMEKESITPGDFMQEETPQRLRNALGALTNHAKDMHTHALHHLPDGQRQTQLPGLIAADLYLLLLNHIEKSHFGLLEQRIALHPLRKNWHAWRRARHYRNM